MPLFADSPTADFGNRNLDSAVSGAVARFGREHPELLRGAKLGVSLVDLTTITNDPPYGGLNDRSEYFVASLAKIAAMYAAYQLRSFVREYAATFQGMVEDLLPILEKQITPLIESQVPVFSKNHPALTKIFTASYNFSGPGFLVDFSSTNALDSKLNELYALEESHGVTAFNETQKLGFLDRLKLMIQWSSNCGACTCIRDLGFQYINAALKKAGFFDAASSTGLWLGASYASGCSGASRGETKAVGNVPIVNKEAGDEVFQVATPRSVAKMLRAIADLKLVRVRASLQMKNLLDKSTGETSSPIGLGLIGPAKVFSKLGVGVFTVCDGAIIENQVVPSQGIPIFRDLNYVAVVLGMPKMPGNGFAEQAKGISILAPYLERSLSDALFSKQPMGPPLHI
jgi:hypothetical protein